MHFYTRDPKGHRCLFRMETDLFTEYALNAVNQGVTSLGIKGM